MPAKYPRPKAAVVAPERMHPQKRKVRKFMRSAMCPLEIKKGSIRSEKEHKNDRKTKAIPDKHSHCIREEISEVNVPKNHVIIIRIKGFPHAKRGIFRSYCFIFFLSNFGAIRMEDRFDNAYWFPGSVEGRVDNESKYKND